MPRFNDPPWHPITDQTDLKHLGKLAEETGELSSAIARCIIQGIDEREPVTGKINRQWLEEEIADVLANLDLVILHLNLDTNQIWQRKNRKIGPLRAWHNDAKG